MIDYIKRLLRTFGFGKRLPQMTVEEGRKICDDVDTRLIIAQNVRELAAAKGRRLAQIAQHRNTLKEQLAKAIRQKTRRVHIYAALDALKREEMAIAGDLP